MNQGRIVAYEQLTYGSNYETSYIRYGFTGVMLPHKIERIHLFSGLFSLNVSIGKEHNIGYSMLQTMYSEYFHLSLASLFKKSTMYLKGYFKEIDLLRKPTA